MFMIYLQTVLHDIDGLEAKNDLGQPLRYKEACCRAVVANVAQDQGETIDRKMKRWELYKKLSQGGVEPVTMSAEEIVLLKERLHLSYGPLIFGQIVDCLEGR